MVCCLPGDGDEFCCLGTFQVLNFLEQEGVADVPSGQIEVVSLDHLKDELVVN